VMTSERSRHIYSNTQLKQKKKSVYVTDVS
jgi:hypothetical protein